MGEQTRETLRKFFKAGRLPTEDHFSDLIESMLNMKDEGFRKSPENGLEVSAPGDHHGLLSLYRDRDPREPLWSLGYGKESDKLQFNRGRRDESGELPPVLCLDVHQALPVDGSPGHRLARVGINTEQPQHMLDVAGVAAAKGRIGTWTSGERLLVEPGASVLADGEPHAIIEGLSGCHAFEIVAGVGGGSGSGRYALLHAVAMNTYNPRAGWFDFLRPRRGIRATMAHYGRRCDRLQLRWEGDHAKQGKDGKEGTYRLTLGTRCDYGKKVVIRYSITQLWFDPTMSHCQLAGP